MLNDLPPTVAWTVGPLILVAALYAAAPLLRVALRMRARRHDRLKIFTLANHKGGVGKTTTAFFLAKQLAATNVESRVLVIDCSIYGDITRLLLGSAQDDAAESMVIDRACTVEDYARAVLARATAYLPFLYRRAEATRHVYRLRDRVSSAPPNLYLMSNRAQWQNGPHGQPGAGEHSGLQEMGNDELGAVAQTLRASLAEAEQPWIVIVDTDGGLLHGMTKLALCVADSVIVPSNADTADMRRLRVMLRYMQTLRDAGLSTATIGMCFFNSLHVKANEPSDEMARLGLGFSVQPDVYAEMQRLCVYLREMRAEFPRLLEMAVEDASAAEVSSSAGAKFFAGIRHGGVTMQRVKDRPYEASLSAAVAGDFDALARRVGQLIIARKLF